MLEREVTWQANGGGFVYFDTRRVGGIITELMVTPN
jgi:hypothetical protein